MIGNYDEDFATLVSSFSFLQINCTLCNHSAKVVYELAWQEKFGPVKAQHLTENRTLSFFSEFMEVLFRGVGLIPS